jgi:hypothetical protein
MTFEQLACRQSSDCFRETGQTVTQNPYGHPLGPETNEGRVHRTRPLFRFEGLCDSCYFPNFSANSAFMRFHESSSAPLLYFMPGLPTLSASGTVKLWTAPG